MSANPYLMVVLFVLAMVGFTLAMHRELHPSTLPRDLRWCRWMVIFGALAVFDAAMLMQAA